jgi:hypothetical protein
MAVTAILGSHDACMWCKLSHGLCCARHVGPPTQHRCCLPKVHAGWSSRLPQLQELITWQQAPQLHLSLAPE